MSGSIDLPAALRDYRLACQAIEEWDAEFAPMLQHRAMLASAVEEAKAAIKTAMAERELDFVEDDDFAVSLVRQDRGTYDPDRLPAKIRCMPGVLVTSVDRVRLEKLMKAVPLTAEDRAGIAAAWQPKPIAPYVKVSVKTQAVRS